MRSDEQLWLAARAGDADAFGTLFQRHADAVYTHCFRRTGSWIDAQDLTSMVFLEAWRKSGQVRLVDGSLKPWLLVVATNVTRGQARARRRYEAMLMRLPRHTEPILDSSEEVLANLEAEERTAELARALLRLGRREQDVIGLCDLGELSYAQAAIVLNVPVGTVRSRLSRARAKLRRELADSAAAMPRTAPLTIIAAQGDLR